VLICSIGSCVVPGVQQYSPPGNVEISQKASTKSEVFADIVFALFLVFPLSLLLPAAPIPPGPPSMLSCQQAGGDRAEGRKAFSRSD